MITSEVGKAWHQHLRAPCKLVLVNLVYQSHDACSMGADEDKIKPLVRQIETERQVAAQALASLTEKPVA